MRGALLCTVLIAGAVACSQSPPAPPAAPAAIDVIVDHDGGVDDLIALTLLMKSPAVRVRAVTICPADSYLEPATRATQLFLDRLGGHDISIAQGHSEGSNPFPAEWRRDASRALDIALLKDAGAASANPIVPADAAHHLVTLLSGTQKFTVLETGPMTNIAAALAIDPSIRRNITRIYAMGGAVRVKGNVEQAGHDGSAEWNFFNQPQAAADVVRSGIPITLVPLDATNKVPLTPSFLDRLKRQPSTASQLASQAWGVTYVQQQNGVTPYYFWDTLTAAALLNHDIVRTERVTIRVPTSGSSQGRTEEDPGGAGVYVAVDANRQATEQLFLDVLGR